MNNRPEPPNGFLRNFLVLQGAFVVFLLIASINEPPSAYNPAAPATQMALVTGLWLITDLTAVAVHAVRVHTHRADR